MEPQGIHEQLLDFLNDKLQYLEPAEILNNLVQISNKIKRDNKLSRCSGCKQYKIAGTQCRSICCKKFMTNVKCPECLRSFVKNGNHKCVKSQSYPNKNAEISRDFYIL